MTTVYIICVASDGLRFRMFWIHYVREMAKIESSTPYRLIRAQVSSSGWLDSRPFWAEIDTFQQQNARIPLAGQCRGELGLFCVT